MMTIQMNISKDEDYVKPFHVQMVIHTQHANFQALALLDTGVDCNVLSYDAWMDLGQPELANVHTNF